LTDERDGLAGRLTTQRVADEQTTGAFTVEVRPAVRYRHEHASVVVADPGPACFLVLRRDDAAVVVEDARRSGGATDRLVAVRRRGYRRPVEHLPREYEGAHGQG